MSYRCARGPPYQCAVDNVAIIDIDQFVTSLACNSIANSFIAVIVYVEFLDNLILGESEADRHVV